MLHSQIAMSKSSDMHASIEPDAPFDNPSDDPADEPQPLNARSLALSALLGTHPPVLSASALVALAELFGISGGAMRTALSRLATAGDVIVDDARYSLAPRLVARQASQDVGRQSSPVDAEGRWHTAVAVADQRELSDRRQTRVVMANARFGELRPDIWLRPANLPAPDLGDAWMITTGVPVGPDPARLVARIWDLDQIARTADRFDARLAAADARIDPDDPTDIPGAFTLSAAVLRFLRSEPLLPRDLTPADWPLDRLRRRYGSFEGRLQAMMRPFLHHGPASGI
jgi:phenylacetic acid degradation operon negative regulatory protein